MADAEVMDQEERGHQERLNAVRNPAANVVKKRVVATVKKSAVAWLLPVLGYTALAAFLIAVFIGLPLMVFAVECNQSSLNGVLARVASAVILPVDICEKVAFLKPVVQQLDQAQVPNSQ